MDMIKRFLEIETDNLHGGGQPVSPDERINRKLFTGNTVSSNLSNSSYPNRVLNIAKYPDSMMHQGVYPTIHLSFENITGDDYDEIEYKTMLLVCSVFDRYKHLLGVVNAHKAEIFGRYIDRKIDKGQLQDGLWFLSDILYEHYRRKPFIFIDDYDLPICRTYRMVFVKYALDYRNESIRQIANRTVQSEFYRNVYDFFWTFFEVAFKSNSALNRGLMTGVYHVKLSKNFRGLNRVINYGLQDERFSAYYGFQSEEVDRLLLTIANMTKVHKDRLKNSYGHEFNNGSRTLYSSLSMNEFMGKAEDDELNDGNELNDDNKFINYLLCSGVPDEVAEEGRTIQKLIDNDTASLRYNVREEIDFEHIPELSLNYLLHSGYLKSSTYGFGEMELSIVNDNIRNRLKAQLANCRNFMRPFEISK